MESSSAYDWLDKPEYTKEILLDYVNKATKELKLRVDATMGSNFNYAHLVGNPTLTEAQEKLKGGGGEIIRSIVEKRFVHGTLTTLIIRPLHLMLYI